MQNKSKLELIAGLRKFREGYYALDKAWQEDTDTDLNKTAAIRYYPFKQAFDAIDVHKWIHETLLELGATVSPDTKILNPKCASCTQCHQVTQTVTRSPIDDGWFQCIGDVGTALECAELMIPYDRDSVIGYLVTYDMNSVHDGFESILTEGTDGIGQLTDLELLEYYNDKIRGKM